MQPGTSVWFLPFAFCHAEPLPSFPSPPLVIYSVFFACQQHKRHWQHNLFFCVFFILSISRLKLPVLLEVECVWGLPPLLFRLHRAVCCGHPAAAGLGRVCGDPGLSGRAVWSHAWRPTVAAKLPQPLHQRNEVWVIVVLNRDQYKTQRSISHTGAQMQSRCVTVHDLKKLTDLIWQQNEKNQVSHWLSYLPVSLLIALNKFPGMSDAIITNWRRSWMKRWSDGAESETEGGTEVGSQFMGRPLLTLATIYMGRRSLVSAA